MVVTVIDCMCFVVVVGCVLVIIIAARGASGTLCMVGVVTIFHFMVTVVMFIVDAVVTVMVAFDWYSIGG